MWGYVVIFEAKKCPRANDLGNTALYRISLLVFITEAECISIVKPTRCTIFSEFIEYHFTCFGRTSRPSLGVQGCTHGIRSYRLVELQFRLVPASTQPANPYDIYLMLCVRSWSPDDGREDRPKHVEYCFQNKINLRYCASGCFYYRNPYRSFGTEGLCWNVGQELSLLSA